MPTQMKILTNDNQKATSECGAVFFNKNHLQPFSCAIFFKLHIAIGPWSRFRKIIGNVLDDRMSYALTRKYVERTSESKTSLDV